jgi:glyoxylase-like metal-dependent hydrolase (beta-lactamase superfamily II)
MNLRQFDLDFFLPNVIASYLIETNDGPVLIETGPDTVYANLEKSINDAGFSVGDIKHVFVTHIHLDHSGAAWHLAEKGSMIYVHPRGADHLADPSKLVASAGRIYGDKMGELWGNIKSVPRDRIRATEDGQMISIGGTGVRVIESLGHASHHNAYMIEGIAFTGDAAGIRIAGGPVVPPTPPPDIHIGYWQETLKKLRDLKPDILYPTHFGPSTDVFPHLEELESRLLEWSDWIGERLKAGKSDEEVTAEYETLSKELLTHHNIVGDTMRAYEFADPFWMNVMGLVRYWRKHKL